jgi:hypothetical protein
MQGLLNTLLNNFNQPISTRADQTTTAITVKLIEQSNVTYPEEIDLATDIHSVWRQRVKDLTKAIDLYTKNAEKIIQELLVLTDEENEVRINDTFQKLEMFREYKEFCKKLLEARHLEPLGHFGREDENPDDEFNFKSPVIEPFTDEDFVKLTEIERACYKTFVVEMLPTLKKVEYVKNELMKIVNQILHNWDAGESKSDIQRIAAESIQKTLKDYLNTFSEAQTQLFANQLFVAATAHKPERVRLSQNQISMLVSNHTTDEKPSGEVMCGICLGDFANNDRVIHMPCCQQYLHVKCADDSFKRRATCIYCRKDLRMILVEPARKQPRLSDDEPENNDILPLIREANGVQYATIPLNLPPMQLPQLAQLNNMQAGVLNLGDVVVGGGGDGAGDARFQNFFDNVQNTANQILNEDEREQGNITLDQFLGRLLLNTFNPPPRPGAAAEGNAEEDDNAE